MKADRRVTGAMLRDAGHTKCRKTRVSIRQYNEMLAAYLVVHQRMMDHIDAEAGLALGVYSPAGANAQRYGIP